MLNCAQSQGIAKYLPKSILTGKEIIVAMRAFCDGSGKADQSSVVILAGVAAEESVWRGFEKEWQKLLDTRCPPAPYVHMNELIQGSGAFKDEKGWDTPKRAKLFWDSVMYAQHLDKRKFRTFVCSVDMNCYREIRAALLPEAVKIFPSYAAICNKYVPMEIFKWYLGEFLHREDLELRYFFDQNEKFCGPFENLWRRKKKKSWAGLFNHWEIIKQVTPANMREVYQLQLADVLAWVWHRHLNPHNEGLPWADIHKVTEAVLPSTRKEVGVKDLTWIANWLDYPTIIKEWLENLSP